MKQRYIMFAGILVWAWVFIDPAPAVAKQPALGLPINCNPGDNCWIVNYVDHDPSKGVLDYACGKATYNAQPGNRHKGIDIAIRDAAAMRRGVEVMAAAAGTVLGVRDGMADIDVEKAGGPSTVRGRECGNGVVIAHPDGWTTQYCHMRKGSVLVKRGERVKSGQIIGMVGSSGLSQYPHLHFQVKKGNKIIDPFVGLKPKTICGPGKKPLWKKDVMVRLPYRPTAIYNVGFAPGVPKSPDRARQGLLATPTLSPKAKDMILWADIFQVRKGDKLSFAITGPGGAKILRYKTVIKKDRTRHFLYAGKPRRTTVWPPGEYRGEIRLVREKGLRGRQQFAAVRIIRIPVYLRKKKVKAVPKLPSSTVPSASLPTTDTEMLVVSSSEVSGIWKKKSDKTRLIWLAIAIGLAIFIIIYNAMEDRKQGAIKAKLSVRTNDRDKG